MAWEKEHLNAKQQKLVVNPSPHPAKKTKKKKQNKNKNKTKQTNKQTKKRPKTLYLIFFFK